MPAKKSWTFSITTLGCKVNQYESEAIAEAWQNLGGIEVKDAQNPQVSLINSCAITAKGERDTRSTLYSTTRSNPNALRILTGCAANLVAKDLSPSDNKQDNYFDILIPPRAKAMLMQGPWQWDSQTYPLIISENTTANPFGENGFAINSFRRTRPIIKVQDGCSHRCTYCIVPLMRGPSVSRASSEILAEAKALLQNGFREILLSGINLHHYGRGASAHEAQDFWDLVQLLEAELAPQWANKARFRISSLEPSQINQKGLDILQSSSLLCPHLHLSLQHGSQRILKAMGRGHYKVAQLEQAIATLRQTWPKLGLGADILMGFPSEEEQDVQETLELIKRLELNYAHVFPYSKRPGTAAENFDKQVPHNLKLEHAARVRKLVESQKNDFLNGLLKSQHLDIVVDNPPAGKAIHTKIYKGIDAHYAPCRLHLTSDMPIHGIIRAKPLRVEDDVLIVSI